MITLLELNRRMMMLIIYKPIQLMILITPKIMNWLKKLITPTKKTEVSVLSTESSINPIKTKAKVNDKIESIDSIVYYEQMSGPSWSHPVKTYGPSSMPTQYGNAGTSGVSGASGTSGFAGTFGTSGVTKANRNKLILEDGIFDDYVTDSIYDSSVFDSFDVDF